MSETNILAGAAVRRITPALERGPFFLAGFQSNRIASGIDLDLYARAMAIRQHDQSIVIVTVDLIGLNRPDVLEIRARLAAHASDTRVIIACTHTHSAPDTLGLWGPDDSTSGVDLPFLESVKQAIVEVAIEALTFCCPALLRVGYSKLLGFIENYRDPAIVDDEVLVAQFIKPDGEVIATLMNLACHPEVLNGESTLLSADYAGAACAALEKQIGGTALHISGALGGMLSPAQPDRTPQGVRRMGQAYANAALQALEDATPHTPDQLIFRRSEITLPFENPLLALAEQQAILRPRPQQGGQITTDLSYLRFGPWQLITIPGELLPRLGFALKEAMTGPCTMIAGISDDELGYILPDDQFIRPHDYLNPGKQYEESMSLGPTTGSLIMAAATELITA
ncbi:MAG: hypothetical protein Fur005_07830 [Roseiflexaceae bacterium]